MQSGSQNGSRYRDPGHLTLLCLSSGRRGCRGLVGEGGAGVEGAVELAGDVALEAALDLTAGLALGSASGDVLLGCRAAPHAGDGDRVDRAVQGSVAAAVEPVPDCPAAAGRHVGWCPTARRTRRRFGTVRGGRTRRWLELR